MIFYIVIAAVSVVLAAGVEKMQRLKVPGKGLFETTRAEAAEKLLIVLLFLVLFIPAALRQQTGNDYMRYVEFFHLASVDAYVPTEEGFNLFVKLIYRLCGYENYLLVFALFAFFTILLFIAAIRRQAVDFAMSFFLFMMSGCYFQTYNTVRYYFALAIALFSLEFFLEKEYVWFVLLILFAAGFHRSVLVVLVLYPLAAHAWKVWQLAITAVLGAAFYATQNFWMQVIVRLYPSYEDTEILAAGGSVSWPNIARCALILLFALVCHHMIPETKVKERSCLHEKAPSLDVPPHECRAGSRELPCSAAVHGDQWPYPVSGKKETDRRMRFYFNAAFFSLELYVFGSFIPELSRICYYLVTTQIFFIPALIHEIPDRKQKKLATALVAVAAAAVFAFFLRKAYDTDIRILPYRTFLFHDLPDTPSRSIE